MAIFYCTIISFEFNQITFSYIWVITNVTLDEVGHILYQLYLWTVLIILLSHYLHHMVVWCIKNARPEFNLYASTHTSNVFRNTRSLAMLWNNQAAWNFGIIKTGHSILATTIDLILTTEKIFEYSKKLDGNNELKDNCINLYNTEVG